MWQESGLNVCGEEDTISLLAVTIRRKYSLPVLTANLEHAKHQRGTPQRGANPAVTDHFITLEIRANFLLAQASRRGAASPEGLL